MSAQARKAGKASAPSVDPQAYIPTKADIAQATLRPSLNAAAVVAEWGKPFGEQDVNVLADSLLDSLKLVEAGDLSRCEAMLYGQAHALQAIFMNLSRRANHVDMMAHWEAYMRMAMKAQNQCRMTLETLATIKNPPVFARQANINNGGQQQIVNGGSTAATGQVRADVRAPAGSSATAPTELLEATDGNWLDTGATAAAVNTDPQLATVGEVERPADR